MKKYEFTGETINHNGKILKRIKRLSDGLIGGWIEKESNLSHKGNCFVFDNAKVFNNAQVFENAQVFSNVQVYENALVFGNAQVFNKAQVFNNAQVYGDAKVFNNALVYGHSELTKGMRASKKVKNILGFTYNITISDDYIKIGCQVKSKKAWLKVTKKQAVNMGLLEGEYKQCYILIKTLQ